MRSDEQINQSILDDIKTLVGITIRRGKGGTNSQSNPFETAYLKDKTTGKVYKATINNGEVEAVECITDTKPEEVPEDLIPGRLLIWHDEFDGTELDTSKWIYEIGGRFRGNPSTELEYYTDNKKNVYVENSILHLKAIRENYQGKENEPYTWTSGALETKGKFAFQYGRLDAKLKMAKAQGSFPAFWLLGDNYNYIFNTQTDNDKGYSNGYPWSNCGEIDIMELFGNKTTVSATIHRKPYIGATNSSTHIGDTTVDVIGWHVYSIEKSENKLEFLIDNKVVQTFTMSNATDKDIFNKTFYVILNNAIGSVAGTPSDSTNVLDYQIDYVRYYAPKDITSKQSSTSISLNKSSLNILKGDSELLQCTIAPGYVDNMSLNWSSSDENVITCYGGYVKALNIGNAVVTVTDHYGHSAICNVVVSEQILNYTLADVSNPSNYKPGHYNSTGQYEANNYRICLNKLVEIEPNTEYKVDITYNSDDVVYNSVIREYDSNKSFTISIGAVANAETFTTGSNAKYISVGIYESSASVSNTRIQQLLTDGSLSITVTKSDNSETQVSKTMVLSNINSNFAQYVKFDGTTGAKGTTTTPTVYGTKDYIDVSAWDRYITGYPSDTSLGGVYIYEYDSDKNYLGRTLLYTNNNAENAGNKYTLKNETSYLNIMITGIDKQTYTLKYKS